jgi:rare lipoprotein A (peptidoglycan hydrolase)
MHCNRAEATSGRKEGSVSLNHRALLRIAGVTAIALTAANCSSNVRGGIDPKYGVSPSPKVIADGQPVPKGGGREMVGKPYTIAGRTYVPSEAPRANEGLASWYGSSFHGRMTANGEIFDRDSVAAAHTTMPLPSYARVTNLQNGHSMIVRVNDRGPFHPGRIIDLSYTAALKLDLLRGVAPVEIWRLTFDEIRSGSWRRTPAPGEPTTAVAQQETAPPASAPPVAVVPSALVVPTVAAPEAAPLPVVPEPAAIGPAGFWVQLGAFREREGALAFQQRVVVDLGGQAPQLAIFNERAMHRLQAGPYASRDDAQRAAQRLREQLQLVPMVVERR